MIPAETEAYREYLVLRALSAYSLVAPKVTFLRHNENMVFHVIDAKAGHAYLLRIHSPLTAALAGKRLHPKGIASELCWLEALSDETSLVLQRPVRTKEGDLVTMIAGEQGDIPSHARTWSVPETFARPVYDLAFHHRQINTLIKGVHDGIIRAGDFTLIQKTLEMILTTLAEAQEPLMLIHADLWRGNLLVSETDVHPIDFSLCGFGSPLFDLGTCLPGIPADLRLILLDACQQQEKLPLRYPSLIDSYFLLSRMGAYVYLLSNFAEHEWLKERIPRFVAQECRLFLEEKALLLGGPF
jgi:hypothetical protein